MIWRLVIVQHNFFGNFFILKQAGFLVHGRQKNPKNISLFNHEIFSIFEKEIMKNYYNLRNFVFNFRGTTVAYSKCSILHIFNMGWLNTMSCMCLDRAVRYFCNLKTNEVINKFILWFCYSRLTEFLNVRFFTVWICYMPWKKKSAV